jgi:signal transduction histidine kinase
MHPHNQKFTTAPANDDQTFRAQLLDSLLLTAAGLLLGASALLLISGLLASPRNMIVNITVALLCLGLRIPLRRGYVRSVSAALIAILVIACVALAFNLGTVRSVIMAYFLIPVMITTFLLGPRFGLALLILSSAVAFALARAEQQGLLGAARTITPFNQWLNLTILLANGFVILYLIRRRFVVVLSRMRSELTARHEAERALSELNASLEARVRERTDALSAANAELTLSARLKDEFLATVSHELRTPLVSILGFTEALKEGVYGEQSAGQQRAAEMIDRGGQRLLKLVTTMLDLVTLNSSEEALTFEPFPITRACTIAFERCRGTAYEQGLGWKLNLEPELGQVVADERRIIQIIATLLDNAIKFTDRGGEVGLEAQRETANGIVALCVWDTGIGIAPERVGQLFKPFVQAQGGLDRPYEGSGLGLALVGRLVELHGGTISLESALGVGSRFIVRLPIAGPTRVNQPPHDGGA